MKILLAEDEDHKIAEITTLLNQKKALGVDLSVSRCVRDSVLPILKGDEFELVVLDMALPTHFGSEEFGGTEQPSGGIEVIRALQEHSQRPIIIILTQHEEITINGKTVHLDEIENYSKINYDQDNVTAILYSYKRGDWKQKFNDVLDQINGGNK